MSTLATERDDSKHPLIGRLMQYKLECYGRTIPTDYPMDALKKKEGFLGISPGPYLSTSNEVVYVNDLARSWLNPTNSLLYRGATHPLYGEAGPHNEKYMRQDPWRYGMPHLAHDPALYVAHVALSTTEVADQGTQHAMLTPIRALSFAAKFRDTTLDIMTYLQCMVTLQDADDDDGAPTRPLIVWCRETWLEPLQTETYKEKLAKKRLAHARSFLDKIRSR